MKRPSKLVAQSYVRVFFSSYANIGILYKIYT